MSFTIRPAFVQVTIHRKVVFLKWPPEEDILNMRIFVWVPFPTSRGPISHSKISKLLWIPTSHFLLPISHFLLPISHFPLPTSNCDKFDEKSIVHTTNQKGEVGFQKCVVGSEKLEFWDEKWEFRSEKWESGKLTSHFPHGIWEVGNGTQMGIPIFKISLSVVEAAVSYTHLTLPTTVSV